MIVGRETIIKLADLMTICIWTSHLLSLLAVKDIFKNCHLEGKRYDFKIHAFVKYFLIKLVTQCKLHSSSTAFRLVLN